MHLSREEYARKRIHNGYLVQIQISVTRVTVWHHSARLVMPNSYPRDGIFNQNLTTIKDSYSCTPACCCFVLFCFVFFFFFFFFFVLFFICFVFFGGWRGVCFLLLLFFFLFFFYYYYYLFCLCFLLLFFVVFLFVCFFCCFFCFFSSLPEPKAHWWAYRICRPPSSVVRLSVCRLSSTLFKHLLLGNHWADWSHISYWVSMGWGNESLFKRSRSHDQDGRHARMW